MWSLSVLTTVYTTTSTVPYHFSHHNITATAGPSSFGCLEHRAPCVSHSNCHTSSQPRETGVQTSIPRSQFGNSIASNRVSTPHSVHNIQFDYDSHPRRSTNPEIRFASTSIRHSSHPPQSTQVPISPALPHLGPVSYTHLTLPTKRIV